MVHRGSALVIFLVLQQFVQGATLSPGEVCARASHCSHPHQHASVLAASCAQQRRTLRWRCRTPASAAARAAGVRCLSPPVWVAPLARDHFACCRRRLRAAAAAVQIVVLFLRLALLGAAMGVAFSMATSFWLSRLFNDPGTSIVLTFGAAVRGAGAEAWAALQSSVLPL